MDKDGEIVVGKFVDRERPEYVDMLTRATCRQKLGEKYVEAKVCLLTEIRIAGFGGQGVMLAANIVGRAGCIYADGYATMTQNYGPEARGGHLSRAGARRTSRSCTRTRRSPMF